MNPAGEPFETAPERVWGGRRSVSGDVVLRGGPHDGHRVWMPAGPLRPWLGLLTLSDGALIPIRSWRGDRPLTGDRVLYRLTDDVTDEGLPVYVLERRRQPRITP